MKPIKHRFPYRLIDNSKLVRPYIPVTLHYRQHRLQPMLALLDSGADFCVFDGELSYPLDLDLSRLETISLSGIAGAATGYVAHIEIGVANTFVPVPVVFSFDFSPKGFGGVIGQVGFFDQFPVAFARKQKTVTIQ